MTTLMVLSFITASAYDFMVDGLAYNVVSLPDLTCEVTYSDTKYSGDIVIPSTVTYQGRTLTVIRIWENSSKDRGAFSDCPSLTSVVIPNSVTRIGKNAFYECGTLTSVEIPNSVTEIGEGAFYKCSALTSIEIPSSVTKIEYQTFKYCWSLTSVEIPNSVTEIGSSAFSECNSLTSVKIPDSVTKIYSYAFIHCSSLKSVEIPNSVTEIGSNAFEGCFSLTSVKIPDSVTVIAYGTFRWCESLVSVEIPNSVTKIGNEAFCGCMSLTSVEIPNSVTEIGEIAFGYCPLKSIIWGSNMNIWFYEKITSWESSPFDGTPLEYLEILPSVSEPIAVFRKAKEDELPSLKKLSLGRSLSYKNKDNFLMCPNLTELELTGYVESFNIGGRNSVKNLTIDNGVELDAGEYGADMSKYDKLECITMKGDVPQFIPTFANAAYLNAKLRVPKGTLQAYQNAEGWKNFWNIEEYDPNSGIDEVPVEISAKTECGRYDLQGRPVDDTYRGVTIIRYTDGSARKVMTTR